MEQTKKELEMQEAKAFVERTEEAAKKLSEANRVQKELLDRQELLNAENTLGGKSEAGAIAPKPEKMSDIDYAKEMMNGHVDPFTSNEDTK